VSQDEFDKHRRDCSWALELELHLKESDPKLYRQLKESGYLKEHCQKAAASAHRMSEQLQQNGLHPIEAQERAKETYIWPRPLDIKL